MSEFHDTDYNDNEIWFQYEAACQGCDIWGPVDDIGLCKECAGKLERDMIRKRDWAYSALAYGYPQDKLEDLRNEVIKKFGKELELIVEKEPVKKRSKGDRKDSRRKR